MAAGITYAVVFFFAGITQQAQFSIRAASPEPVEGWQRIQVEHTDRIVWLSPTAAVVASDIEKAEPQVRDDGDTIIRVVFTDAGAIKMRNLLKAQFKNLVAMVVGDKVLWAPFVQFADVGKESVLTGNGPHGLTDEDVERIMASLRLH